MAFQRAGMTSERTGTTFDGAGSILERNYTACKRNLRTP